MSGPDSVGPDGKVPEEASSTPPTRSITSASSAPSLWNLLGLTRGDQWFLGLVSTIGLLALILFAARLRGWGVAPLKFEHRAEYQYRVDINRATWVEWAQLEGLGEKTAREIVADREANGPFKNIDDLVRVKGIGAKNLERIRPWLILDSQSPTKGTESQENRSEATPQ